MAVGQLTQMLTGIVLDWPSGRALQKVSADGVKKLDLQLLNIGELEDRITLYEQELFEMRAELAKFLNNK